MRTAANNLLRQYRKMLEEKGIKPAKCSGAHIQVNNLGHIAWMCQEAITFSDAERKNRWLGFIQGVLWCQGIYTINQMKEHVVTAYDRLALVTDAEQCGVPSCPHCGVDPTKKHPR